MATRPEDDACYSPCGGAARFEDDASCLVGVSSESSDDTSSTGDETSGTDTGTSSSGESSSTTGPVPCERNEDCGDPAAPFCEVGSGECVTCEGMMDPDAACAEVDPGLALCVEGACVQCTAENDAACGGMTPICEVASNECVPCVAHEECGPAACNLFTGACLPADRVFAVGGPMADFPSLTMAIASLEAGSETTLVVHPGMPDYNEAVVVEGGRVVAFLAVEVGGGVMAPQWVQTSGVQPHLTVETGATALLDGLQLSDNDGVALRVNGGEAWVDRSRLVQNAGGGVLAEAGAELVLRNCFVGGDDNTAAVNIDAATASISFSTLGGGTIAATGLSCTAPLNLEVRNSIIVALGIMATGGVDVACAVADISYTATEAAFVGTGNVAVGELPFMTPEDWFVNYGIGDFHVQNDGLGLFVDVAQWSTGDPPTDIDGDPRPDVDGSPDYAGADVPQ